MFQKIVAYFLALLFITYPSLSHAACQSKSMMEEVLRAEGYPEGEIAKKVSGLEDIEREGEIYLSPDQFVQVFSITPEDISGTWKRRRGDAAKMVGGSALVVLGIAGVFFTVKLWATGGALSSTSSTASSASLWAKATGLISGAAKAVWAKALATPYLNQIARGSAWVVKKVNGAAIKPTLVLLSSAKKGVMAAGGWLIKKLVWVALMYPSIMTGHYGGVTATTYGGLIHIENLTLRDIEEHFETYINDYVRMTTGKSDVLGKIEKVKLTDKGYIIKSLRSSNGKVFYTTENSKIEKPFFAYNKRKSKGRKSGETYLVSALGNHLVPVSHYAWLENYLRQDKPGSEESIVKATRILQSFLPRREGGKGYSAVLKEGEQSVLHNPESAEQEDINWNSEYQDALVRLESIQDSTESVGSKKKSLKEVFKGLKLVAGNLACR